MNLANLTPADIAVIQGEPARRSLKTFIKQYWHIVEPTTPFIDGFHLDAICDHLTNIEDIGNLLILMPPSFAKSLLVDVFFPSWWWASHPADRFIFASHSIALSQRDSLRCRRIIESDLYRKSYGHIYQLVEDQNTKLNYATDKTGFRLATSTDSGVTGERGNFAVLDDAHNVREIESKTIREGVVKWYGEAFSNRVSPVRGYRIIVMQRTHQHDLAGHILKNDTEGNWTRLILPLEYGKAQHVSTRWQDPRTQEGELLCPAYFNARKVQEQKAHTSGASFAAQYNQAPLSGDLFLDVNEIQYYQTLPTDKVRIAAADLAVSGTGDYTVVVTADIDKKGNIFIVDLVRQKMKGTAIVPLIESQYMLHQPSRVFIEDYGIQQVFVQECRLKRIPAKGVHHKGSKEDKAQMLSQKLSARQLYFPTNRPWTSIALEELGEFPNGTHDDIPDCLSIIALEGHRLAWGVREQDQPEQLTQEEIKRKRDEEAHKRYVAMLNDGLWD